jgi:Protein of unknown function (DUF1091)
LRFEKILLKFNPSFVNASFSVNNTADGEAGILNYWIIYSKTVLREVWKLNVKFAKDERDDKYSQLFLSTPISTCKIYEGMQATVFTRVVMENYYKSLNFNLTCPFQKDTLMTLTNCKITDKFIPTTLGEKRVKVEIETSGIIEGMKGMKRLISIELFLRIKK